MGLLLLAGGAGKCSFGTGSGKNGAGMVGSTGGEARRPAKGWNRAWWRQPAALGRSRAEEMSRERGEQASELSRANCFFNLVVASPCNYVELLTSCFPGAVILMLRVFTLDSGCASRS